MSSESTGMPPPESLLLSASAPTSTGASSSLTVASESMRGRQVTLSNHLTRAAEAIDRFKPSALVTADAPLENMGKTGHSVYKHLQPLSMQPLSTFHAATFNDPTITPAGLKAFNTQISTVLRFATVHGSHLSATERAALQTNMLQTRGNLIKECISRLQQCDLADVRAIEELCDVLNQAIKELTLNADNQANVALIKEIDALLTGMLETTAATKPDIAPLLQSAQKRMHQNMLAIRKEEGMGQAHQATSETVQASIAPLISEPGKRGAKLKMSTGAPEEPALTAAGRKTGRWASIKARIKEFFGLVGRSEESRAACTVLMAQIENAFQALPKEEEGGRISHENAHAFLQDIIMPLSENKWFQGTLRNNPAQREMFDRMKATLLDGLIQDVQEELSGHSEAGAGLEMASMEGASEGTMVEARVEEKEPRTYEETQPHAAARERTPVRSPQVMQAEVEYLMQCGANKDACRRALGEIVQWQANEQKAQYVTLRERIPSLAEPRLDELEREISDFVSSGSDVSKQCRAEANAVLTDIWQAKDRLFTQELSAIGEGVNSAITQEQCTVYREAIARVVTRCNPHTAHARREAQTLLRTLDEKERNIARFERNLRDLQPFFAADFSASHDAPNPVRDISKFIRQANELAQFIEDMPATQRGPFMERLRNFHHALQELTPRGKESGAVNEDFARNLAQNPTDWRAFDALVARVQTLAA